ncbi:MAG: hypothetical protein QOK10_2353 [Pseudonocardiales bacterium]|jgi:uncharacterized protein YkwD|nr:hypothetical protein [Pseudonocardiales bacterium]
MALILAAIVTLGVLSPAGAASATTAVTPSAVTATQSVWQSVNISRARVGLPPLAWSLGLQRSARYHNLKMAQSNVLSHQLSGEQSLGTRISSQGVRWNWAAENIGWSSTLTRLGALSIEWAMVNEKAPNDGHRRNILSPTARHVGIDVIFDTVHHKVWLTEDFSN